MTDRYDATLTPEGRVLIPAALRRAAGLRPGAAVSLQLEDGGVVITSPDVARRRLREIFREVDHSLAEELIAERRAEAAAEALRTAPKSGTRRRTR